MKKYQSQYSGEEMDNLFNKANYVINTYTGDGNASQFINLGFTPNAVLVVKQSGQMGDWAKTSNEHWCGGLATQDMPVISDGSEGKSTVLSITENGFNVYYKTSHCIYSNQKNAQYAYIAFR